MQTSLSSTLIGLLLFLVAACTEGTADAPAAHRVTTWTLDEDLRIDEEEDYYLGSAADVAVRADGVLLVLDREEHHVKIISPEGKLIQTVGRQGEGPGEFRSPHQAALARGDSLFVMDERRRLSVFAPVSYAPARTVQVPGSPEGMRYPMELMLPPEEGFLISYAVPPALGGGVDPILYRIGKDGGRLGPVDIPQQGQERIRIEAKKTVMPLDVPFDRRSVVAMGPEGHLYHGVTDSLAITVSDPSSGNALDHWALSAEARPVTGDDLHAFAEGYAATVDEEIREATRVAVRETLREADLPDTQPAFYDLLVDDQQRVWVRRDPEHVETATWWVASTDGELLAKLTLPSTVRLEAVRGGYAYGVIRGGDELPTVIRYRIEAT